MVAAIVYAVTGGAAGALVALDSESSDYNRFRSLTEISGAAFKIAVGAFGVVGGAVLLRVYTKERHQAALETQPDNATNAEEEKERPRPWMVSSIDVLRVLFVLAAAFTLVWVTTGVLIAQDASDLLYRAFPPNAEAGDGPSQTFITLATLNTVVLLRGRWRASRSWAPGSLVAYDRVRGRATLGRRRARSRVGPVIQP